MYGTKKNCLSYSQQLTHRVDASKAVAYRKSVDVAIYTCAIVAELLQCGLHSVLCFIGLQDCKLGSKGRPPIAGLENITGTIWRLWITLH